MAASVVFHVNLLLVHQDQLYRRLQEVMFVDVDHGSHYNTTIAERAERWNESTVLAFEDHSNYTENRGAGGEQND